MMVYLESWIYYWELEVRSPELMLPDATKGKVII